MEFPAYDCRPENPFFGPLSAWLLGEAPFADGELIDSLDDLAERLGATRAKLTQIRGSKKFRDFHNQHTSNITEIVARRQELLDLAYERGAAGDPRYLAIYLKETKGAEALAAKGALGPVAELSIEDAKDLTDAELAAFIESETS